MDERDEKDFRKHGKSDQAADECGGFTVIFGKNIRLNRPKAKRQDADHREPPCSAEDCAHGGVLRGAAGPQTLFAVLGGRDVVKQW